MQGFRWCDSLTKNERLSPTAQQSNGQLTKALVLCVVADKMSTLSSLLGHSYEDILERFDIPESVLRLVHEFINVVHGVDQAINAAIVIYLSYHNL